MLQSLFNKVRVMGLYDSLSSLFSPLFLKLILYRILHFSMLKSFQHVIDNLLFFFIRVIVFVFQDLESKSVVDELKPEVISINNKSKQAPECVSLAWSADGQTLFAGYTDNLIRVWQVTRM